LVCTRSSEHIFTPARAECVAFEAHAKTVIVSYSVQSWSQQHFASHTPAVRSQSQIFEATPNAGSPISWLPQQLSGLPGSSASE